MIPATRTRAVTPPVAPPPSVRPGRVVVPYQRPEPPSLAEIAPYFELAQQAGWYSNGGPCARLLADRLAARLGGGTACVPTASGTLALMAALRALCGPGGGAAPARIATPAFTFTATAGAIAWAGFEPLFVDVDPVAWQLDPDALAAALDEAGEGVAGVLACSTFGTPPPAATRVRWRTVCADHGVPLLLDSAAAFGGTDDAGRAAGSHGDVEAFSFHATKPFAVGEGGLVACPDEGLAGRLVSLLNFGLDAGRRETVALGLNGKMSELAAATALAMLDRFDDDLARRRANVAALRERLAGLPAGFQAGADGSTWQVFQLTLPTRAERDAALRAAGELGVEARACFDPPLHRHPAYARFPVAAGGLPATERVAARSLSLPMARTLSPDELDRIAAVVRRAIAGG